VNIIVLFNLKHNADPDAYLEWARSTDIPNVRALGSVSRFRVFTTTGVLGSDDAAPYQYVEQIEISGMDQFLEDVSTPLAQQIAVEFQVFADAPVFMIADEI
jgi:hypothetical protein